MTTVALPQKTVALVWRMLAGGMHPETVAATTGVDLGVVLDLQAEMPTAKAAA